jgi:hypothetical protein
MNTERVVIKGNVVTFTDRAITFPSSGPSRNVDAWKFDAKRIAVYRDIARAARLIPETQTIRSNAATQVRCLRSKWKQPIRTATRTVTVKRFVKNYKKRIKERALLQRYNTRTYSNYKFEESFAFDVPQDAKAFRHGVIRSVTNVNHTVRNVRAYYSDSRTKNKQKYLPNLGITVSYTTINGVMAPGELERLSKYIRTQQIWVAKKPTTSEKHFGIEIECFGPISRESLGEKLIEAKLGRYVELKSDGSVRPNHSSEIAFELAIVVPESKLKPVIESVCSVLADSKCSVNKSCGLHVHLDARGQSPDKMFSNLVSAQSILYMMQPQSRRENTYCEKTGGKDLRAEIRKGKRYLGINPMSYRKHSTIEVRLHSGTVDARKILNFVAILNSVAYKQEYTKRGASTIKGFVKQNGLSTELEQYITERINKFNTSSTIEEAV